MVALKYVRERMRQAAIGSDLGGSSKYSNMNFED